MAAGAAASTPAENADTNEDKAAEDDMETEAIPDSMPREKTSTEGKNFPEAKPSKEEASVLTMEETPKMQSPHQG